MTNKNNTTLYIGVTSNLAKRVYEHKNHLVEGFTDRYNIEKLIYYEQTTNIKSAIEREKQLKKWSRIKKENLINSMNKEWRDLSEEF